jgi:uncharacterized membrane protein YebE (DUF533 family)
MARTPDIQQEVAAREVLMANWRNLCKAALLADGQIDEREVDIIRKEFFADGRIDRTELEFLVEVRRAARSVVPSFQKLLFEAIRNVLLRDGSIDAAEAAWLRGLIFADGKVDADEKHWLKELKLLADRVSPEFMALYNECMAS